MKLAGKPELNVKVMSPAKTYFEGKALSVSAVNQVGPFDILKNHANFFSLLTEGTVAVNTGDEVFSFLVTHGIVKVSNNTVTLFIDISPAATKNPEPMPKK